jgi:hypothetical protein
MTKKGIEMSLFFPKNWKDLKQHSMLQNMRDIIKNYWWNCELYLFLEFKLAMFYSNNDCIHIYQMPTIWWEFKMYILFHLAIQYLGIASRKCQRCL